MTEAEKAKAIRGSIPEGGLFQDKHWRVSPEPFRLPKDLQEEIQELGPRLHAFNKACNLLYRQSVEGKQPDWIHRYLDMGKPPHVVEMARERAWRGDVPAVIRPDLLLTEDGFAITELDSVPGGIGLTAWFQDAYALGDGTGEAGKGMLEGFESIFAGFTAVMVSDEAKDYLPEMQWLSSKGNGWKVCRPEELEYRDDGVWLGGKRLDTIYRFFELFDLPNIPGGEKLVAAAKAGQVKVTPPLKPQLEEKLWFALFWFPQLAEFWRRELGHRYWRDSRKRIPYTWLLDPAPLPPHAVISQLEIQDWEQLSHFTQKQRDLILKISGFSERAWGSRGVFLGSDMPSDEWKEVVTKALAEFHEHPHILQRFSKTSLVEHSWFDFEKNETMQMKGRLRLCPYYFVSQDKPALGGMLATICPADKKLIHGMQDAILTIVDGEVDNYLL